MRLKATDIDMRLGGRTVLDQLSAETPEVHALAVIGPSGGGKTTLLRILAGLLVPDAGEVEIDGGLLPTDEEGLLRHRRSIGTVFQSFNLFPHLTALQNIVLPLERVHGHTREEAREIAAGLLSRFRLAEHGGKTPAELSGGQQQRVAIARAIAVRPRFLLFDEPTSALDPEMTAEVLDIIGELRAEGRDIVLVTHEMGFARRVADHCLFVAEGRVAESGPAGRLFEAPQSEALRRFLERVLRY